MKAKKTGTAPKVKGYSEAGASMIRRALKSFLPDSGSPNEDINRNNRTLRQRARLLYMSSPVATSAINMETARGIVSAATEKKAPVIFLLGQNMMRRHAKAELLIPMIKRKNGKTRSQGVIPFHVECLSKVNDSP